VKRAGIRIACIGIFHMVLYGYLVPFVIYPRFGNNGLRFALVVAVMVSVTVLGTLWMGKTRKNNKGE